MSDQRGSSSEDRKPRWSPLLRNATVTGLGSGLISLPLKFLGIVPEIAVVRLFAIVTVAAAIAYAVRWEMHRRVLRLHGAKGRLHVAAVAAEGVVALAFLLCGPTCFLWPEGVRQCAAALVLLVFVFTIALVMAWLARHRDLKTGTDVADHCGLIKFIRYDILEPFEHVSLFKWLKERWDLLAPKKGMVSYLTLWLCASLVTVACANTPKVGPSIYRAFTADVAVVKQIGAEAAVSAPPRKATVAMAAAPPTEMPALAAKPTYGQLCRGANLPGAPAPAEQRDQLFQQWLGGGGLGAIFAGCAGPAHPAGGGLWYAVGRCHGAVRSVAIATSEGSGGMLLWAPARFALARARDGSLLDASSSRLVGEGEIYAVQTIDGTYAILRSRLDEAGAKSAQSPRSCGDVREGAPFLVLPPALTRLWSTRVATTGAWLWPVSEHRSPDGTRTFRFRAAYPANDEAVGRCRSNLDCELEGAGTLVRSVGPGPADISTVLARAP